MASPPASEPSSTGPVRICSRTGLALVRHPVLGTWRVHEKFYGPVKGRPRTSPNPHDWNRFDLPDQATLYTSTSRRGAFAEVLAPLRPRLTELTALAASVFDDVAVGDDPITEEWCSQGHMMPGNVSRSWRNARLISQIHIPTTGSGWFVDVESPESLQVLRAAMAPVLLEQDASDMDVATVRGSNRIITCGIAEWVVKQYLDDGSVPLGIRYNSRLGTEWECWATFPDTSVQSVDTSVLELNDTDLGDVAQLFGLRLH